MQTKVKIMPLKVALQMDPIENINIEKDSSFALGIEAQKRGYELYYYQVKDLRLENGKVQAFVYPVHLRKEKGNHYTLGEAKIINLGEEMDTILIRQDPPFDMNYITATYILEHIKDQTLILNDPTEIRNSPEKILVTYFPDLAPETLITSDKNAIKDFYNKHKNVILKPLYGNGGEQIFHIDENGLNINALLEMFDTVYKEPIIAQKYIPEVRKGDKRIILIDGEIAGAFVRVPVKGETRANLDAGGASHKAVITDRDKEICERLKPVLKERNLVFTGIDIIGDYITEINVTSPTGIMNINKLEGTCLESDLWDAFERKLEERS